MSTDEQHQEQPTRLLDRPPKRLSGSNAALLLLALLAVLAAATAFLTQAGAQPVPRAAPSTLTAGAPAAAGRPVVFMGDSYTAGTPLGGMGASNHTRLLAERFGLSVTNTANGSTGYVEGGARAYASQVARIPPNSQLVVIEGSRNDVTARPADVTRAALDVFERVRASAPQAQVVVIGPLAAWDLAGRDLLSTRDAVRDAAEQAGIQFIDPLADRWLDRSDIAVDNVHPTDAGHAALADRAAAALRGAGALG